jgi:hypothetical protein
VLHDVLRQHCRLCMPTSRNFTIIMYYKKKPR